MKDCLKCNGTGNRSNWQGITIYCLYCNGRGHFEQLNVEEILLDIKGRSPGTLRSSKPTTGARSYYVWRVARFHGGIDLTLPILAMIDIEGDPFKPDLDQLAEGVAKAVFGSDMEAAKRWGKALGYV